jgi:hypothetical protein
MARGRKFPSYQSWDEHMRTIRALGIVVHAIHSPGDIYLLPADTELRAKVTKP